MQKKNNRGRKAGSPNRFTLQSKQQLAQIVIPQLEKILKGLNAVSFEKRFSILIQLLPYFLSKGKVSHQEVEVQLILEKHLMPHYNKIGIYFSHLDDVQKEKALVKILGYMTPKQIKSVIPVINKQINRRKK